MGALTKWPIQMQTLRTTRNTQNNKTHHTFRKTIFIGFLYYFRIYFYLFIEAIKQF